MGMGPWTLGLKVTLVLPRLEERGGVFLTPRTEQKAHVVFAASTFGVSASPPMAGPSWGRDPGGGLQAAHLTDEYQRP